MNAVIISLPVEVWNIVSVCLAVVCLSVRSHISKPHVQISPNVLCLLPLSVDQFSSDGNAIRYAFPVLWTTSCFHILQGIGQNQRRRVCFVHFARWRHRWRSLSSVTASCFICAYNQNKDSVVSSHACSWDDAEYISTTLVVQVEQSVRFVCVCVCACLCPDYNFWTKLPLTQIFGILVQLDAL